MKTLYKYYSSNFDILKYLNAPTMRFTQLSALNDPFEGMLTDTILSIISPRLQQQLSPNTPITKRSLVYVKRYLNENISAYGICSLSETYRNLLMWSHYSSEHQGLCIGYNPDMLDKKSSRLQPQIEKTVLLKKVNYDSIIFDEEHIDRILQLDMDKEDIFPELAERALTTKSNEWQYEKEHRYISDLSTSDKITIFKKNADIRFNERLDEIIEKIKSTGSHDIIFNQKDEEVVLITKRDINASVLALTDPNSVESLLSKFKPVLFSNEITQSDITSIYLGCNYDDCKEKMLIKAISENENLKHIKVYKCRLSKTRFELDQDRIHPKKNEL